MVSSIPSFKQPSSPLALRYLLISKDIFNFHLLRYSVPVPFLQSSTELWRASHVYYFSYTTSLQAIQLGHYCHTIVNQFIRLTLKGVVHLFVCCCFRRTLLAATKQHFFPHYRFFQHILPSWPFCVCDTNDCPIAWASKIFLWLSKTTL